MTQDSEAVSLSAAAGELLQAFWAFLPHLLAALFLLLAGWVVALVLRGLCTRLVTALQTLQQRLPWLDRPALQRPLPLQLLPKLVYWVVLIGFVAAATQILGLSLFADWLDALLTQVPGLLGAVAVVFAAAVSGQLARDLVVGAAASAGLQYPGLLGAAAQLSLLALGAIIGLELLGLDSTSLTVVAGLVIGMIGAGIALSFGLGAQTRVSNLLGARDARSHYQAGERIRIGEWEGVILDITSHAVVLDTELGRAVIPAHLFAQMPSTLLSGKDDV